jgi:hypothetical protein
MSTDAAKAQAFYTSLLGWGINPQDMMGFIYNMIMVDGKGIGGIVPLDPAESLHTHWMSYLQVPGAIEESVAKIKELGGEIVQEPFEIPDVRFMAVAKDPQGAYFAPMQPTGYQPEEPTYPLPGGAVAWHELMTKDTAAAAEFYTGVTGLSSSVQDMGTGPYTLLQEGENDYRAGIMANPDPNFPPAWLIYFEVPQATMDDALADVTRLGGQVAMGPMEVPGVGVIGVGTDPTGGWFGLMKSAL